jgi:hypothetical protein
VRLSSATAFILAAAATMAHGQATQPPAFTPVLPAADHTSTVVPVLDRGSGRIEALLLLEAAPRSPLERVIGAGQSFPNVGLAGRLNLESGRSVEAALKLEAKPGLALLCNGASGLMTTLGSLAEHCLVATLDRSTDPLAPYSTGLRARTRYDLPNGRFELSLGLQQLDLGPATRIATPSDNAYAPVQAWQSQPFNPLAPLGLFGGEFERQDLSLGAQFVVGKNGWVSIGGTVARARLLPANVALSPQQWESAEMSLGAGFGAFSGAITSRVIDVAGQGGAWGGLDVGFTWRTPWQARLTIGAQNLVTRGNRNPWGLPDDDVAEAAQGRVPYVRYQQDL